MEELKLSAAQKVVRGFIGSTGIIRNSTLVEMAMRKIAKEDKWITIELIEDEYIRLSTAFAAVGIKGKPYTTKTMVILLAKYLNAKQKNYGEV